MVNIMLELPRKWATAAYAMDMHEVRARKNVYEFMSRFKHWVSASNTTVIGAILLIGLQLTHDKFVFPC